jgi:carboxyl-terminal processing protease
LERENERRVSRGLPPITKKDEKVKEDNFDFIQDETVKIITDYISDRKIVKK